MFCIYQVYIYIYTQTRNVVPPFIKQQRKKVLKVLKYSMLLLPIIKN